MDAYEDFATYLENMGDAGRQSLKGNMHFFVGNLVVAKWFWALGFTTSFTGVLTFTDEYNEVVREAPLDMILTETDAPYASPVPHRGKRNEPAFVPLVAKAVARIRGEDEEKLGEAALANARRIFKIEA
jgi:TatD DNase family protein